MRSSPKINVKPLATTNSSAAKVNPLRSWKVLISCAALSMFTVAFGPVLRYQSRICSPVMKATSGFCRIVSKMRRKYLARCGAPMM